MPYTDFELVQIALQKASMVGYRLADELAIAEAAGGSPGEIKNLVEAYDAYAVATGDEPTRKLTAPHPDAPSPTSG